MPITHGPAHRWFAWRPVDTQDRGWLWFRPVWRCRVWYDIDGLPAMRGWKYRVRL